MANLEAIQRVSDQHLSWCKTQFAPWVISVLKEEVGKRAPAESDERRMLTRGTVTKWLVGAETTGNVGTDRGGRFKKTGPSIREIIDSIRYNSLTGRLISSPPSSAGTFSWKRRDGTVLETVAFGGRFLYAVEGTEKAPWMVRPRPDRRVLEPEPNIFCLEIMKRAKVYHMFEAGKKATYAKVMPVWRQSGLVLGQMIREVM